MEKVHVDWLLGELKVLVEKGVVTSEVSTKISDYYKNEKLTQDSTSGAETCAQTNVQKYSSEAAGKSQEPASDENIYKLFNEKNKKTKVKVPSIGKEQIPVVLSVIASLLIASGIISLIAYNWNAIPRFAKAVTAFIMLLAVQGLGTLVMFKKNLLSKKHWKEGASVLWSLLFGAAVAFISQICRLPGNTSAFFLIWSLSSILITYAMQSTWVFVLALLQSVAYAFAYNSSEGGAFVFCILFLALLPFARTKKYGVRIMLCLATVMMGTVLEKGIPGLWIVCSVSFAALCLEYAIKYNDKFIKALSFAGLCILLLVLTTNDPWIHVGWNFARTDSSLAGNITDCVLTLLLTLAATIIPWLSVIKEKKKASYDIVYSLCVLIVAALYIAYAFMPASLQTSSMIAPTVIVYLLAFLFSVHALYSKIFYSATLLLCLSISIFIAGFTNLLFAVVSLTLLLEGFIQYQVKKSGKQKSHAGHIILRILAFILFGVLAYNDSLINFEAAYGKGMAQIALSSAHFMLYALCAAAAIYFIAKASFVKYSGDLIITSLALLLLFIVNIFCKINSQTLCFVLLLIEFTACTYDFCLWQTEEHSLPFGFWAPFIAVFAYYFYSGLNFNYPIIAACAFLLLLEALGRYRSRKNRDEGECICILVRAALAILFIAIGFYGKIDMFSSALSPETAHFQLAVYALYAVAAIILLFMSKTWIKSLDAIILIAIITLFTFWKDNSTLRATLYHTVYLCASACGTYLCIRKKKESSSITLQILFAIPYLLLLAANIFYGQVHLFLQGNFIIITIPLCALLYYYAREKIPMLGNLAELIFAITLFLASLIEIECEVHPYEHLHGTKDYPFMISCIAHTLLFAFIVFLPVVKNIIRKVTCNYLIALYTLAVFILMLICESIPLSGYVADSNLIGKIFILVSFLMVFLNAGYYIAHAYKSDNLALANAAGGAACLTIIIKFFSDDYSFVVKGVIFIILGIVMLLLNLFLLQQNKNSKKEEKND